MPLNHDRLLAWSFADQIHRYEARDTILYALGIGCGDEPQDLRFVYEDGLHALPSMATILGDPGFWLRDPVLGADWRRAVHGEQSITLHAPLATSGSVVARNAIDAVVDKGPESGVFVYCSRTLHAESSGDLIATLRATIILRGDGRVKSWRPASAPKRAVPDRPPDMSVAKRTLAQAALIYRLSGDLNPLHADPQVARSAGFPQPILHGLCTMGLATRAIVRACCDDEPRRLRSIGVRFSAPVFPGETIRTDIWRSDGEIQFRCLAVERGAVVLDAATARVAP